MRRRLAAVAAVVLALPVIAVGASAVVDHPARYYREVVIVQAPRKTVWAVLTDFGAYREWNPYITRASGRPIEGTELDLRRHPVGQEPKDVSARLLIVREKRKLEWLTRIAVPGILDHEQIFRLVQLGPARTRLVTETRFEGVLAPFYDTRPRREGLARMARALAARAESAYQSSSE